MCLRWDRIFFFFYMWRIVFVQQGSPFWALLCVCLSLLVTLSILSSIFWEEDDDTDEDRDLPAGVVGRDTSGVDILRGVNDGVENVGDAVAEVSIGVSDEDLGFL